MTTTHDKEAAERELLDEDGENRAVRCFLMLYGGTNSPTTKQMRYHLTQCGYPYWPQWASGDDGHLTKGGAQDWLRHLFALERAALASEVKAVAPEGYALISVDALKAWGKYDEVREACRYPAAASQHGEDWSAYLKDGETPLQRFLREREDSAALLALLAKERARCEELEERNEAIRNILLKGADS